jgi:hypothetical protein
MVGSRNPLAFPVTFHAFPNLDYFASYLMA